MIKWTGILKYIVILIVFLYSSFSYANYIDSTEYNGIIYVLEESPDQISRYEIATDTWLTPIPLIASLGPLDIEVHSTGIIVAFDRITYRYSFDGQTQTHITNSAASNKSIVIVNDILGIFSNDNIAGLKTVDLNTLIAVDTINSLYSNRCVGPSSAGSLNRVFCRTSGLSPSDIAYIDIDPIGQIGDVRDSPHHGSYPTANKTWVFYDETRVVDDSGNIYSADSLQWLGSLGSTLDDLIFINDLPIVLNQNDLIAYSSGLLEQNRYSLSLNSIALFESNAELIVLSDNSGQFNIERIMLSDFSSLQPGEPINPVGLEFTPDTYLFDDIDGDVYMLSKLHASVFVWSINSSSYQPTISLIGVPEYVSLDKLNKILYVTYNDGRINKIDLNGNLNEEHFASLPQSPLGMSQAGEYVFLVDPSGAWVSHYTFSKQGTLISAVEWNYRSNEYIWSDALSKMYFFRDDTSPNDLLWEDIDSSTGIIGAKMDSPYHSSQGIKHPIRVSPTGSEVILGSGRIYDPITLSQINSLTNDITDATWINNKLYTTQDSPEQNVIQTWSSTYAPSLLTSTNGMVERIFEYNGNMLVIRLLNQLPKFDYINPLNLPDSDLDNYNDLEDNCPAISNTNQSNIDGDEFGDVCDAYPNDSTNTFIPSALELFPINPLTIKTFVPSETQITSNNTEVVNSTIVNIINFDDNSRINFTNDQDGLREHRNVEENGDTLTLSPPAKYLNAQPMLNDVITSTGTATFDFSELGLFNYSYTHFASVIGYETVTVPHGTYNALRVDTTLSITGTSNGIPLNINNSGTDWYVGGIGIVKATVTENLITETSELESIEHPPSFTQEASNQEVNNGSTSLSWSSNQLVSAWRVNIGSLPGGFDYHESPQLIDSSTDYAVSNLPQNGETLYITLLAFVDGVWIETDTIQLISNNASNTAETVDVPLPLWFYFVMTVVIIFIATQMQVQFNKPR